MLRPSKNSSPRWRKITVEQSFKAEAFLRARERFCVAASSRFLRIQENHGHVWYLNGKYGEISALLLHNRRALFPVFDRGGGYAEGKSSAPERRHEIPGPRFLKRFLGKVPIHAIQGLREDAELLEILMEKQGYFATEKIDYDLMNINGPPKAESFNAGPDGLILRDPAEKDEEDLYALQCAYELEEVLPQNASFNPAACRLNLKHILSSENILLAELNGRVVGKINTSAESFTRYQVGGVYVHPEYRRLGIALKMTAVFIQSLLNKRKGITLFVKKSNAAAGTVYRKAGFNVLADYRITYYG